MRLHVREIKQSDVPLIVDYWKNSSPEHLQAMGVDLEKLPLLDSLQESLENQINSPIDKKSSYALIWEINGVPSGHCNINNIELDKKANMHLHIWSQTHRLNGAGTELVKRSLPFFFKKFGLKELLCEPYLNNKAPNRTLKKVGFEFIKSYITIPGSINFEQEVNQWVFTRERFDSICTS